MNEFMRFDDGTSLGSKFPVAPPRRLGGHIPKYFPGKVPPQQTSITRFDTPTRPEAFDLNNAAGFDFGGTNKFGPGARPRPMFTPGLPDGMNSQFPPGPGAGGMPGQFTPPAASSGSSGGGGGGMPSLPSMGGGGGGGSSEEEEERDEQPQQQ